MLPLFLGHIAVKRYETLGGMIQKVYGLYNNHYLNYITKVNPLIVQTLFVLTMPSVLGTYSVPRSVSQRPVVLAPSLLGEIATVSRLSAETRHGGLIEIESHRVAFARFK